MFSRRNCFSSRCALQCQRIINWTHTPSPHATFTYATLLVLLISILVLHTLLNPIPSSYVSLHLCFTHTSKPHPIFTCQISSCFVRTTNKISRIYIRIAAFHLCFTILATTFHPGLSSFSARRYMTFLYIEATIDNLSLIHI